MSKMMGIGYKVRRNHDKVTYEVFRIVLREVNGKVTPIARFIT